jgi:molybdopterin-guanine dinucleotide biosynthesis protein A
MPGIEHEQLVWVARELETRPEIRVAMPRREGMVEPFPSGFRKSALAAIADQLGHQRRAMQGLLKVDGFVAVDAPASWPNEAWINLNTPEDLSRFL